MDCPKCNKKLPIETENRLGGIMLYARCKTDRCNYVSAAFVSTTDFKKQPLQK
jgi:ssDNA-binding Zn-finger/Zn-ribbon topoisomerase 1